MLPKDDGDRPALSVQGATLEGHELAAVFLAGAGSYLIEDSVLEGGVGQGYLSCPEYDRPVDPPDWYQYEARIEVAM